MLPCLIGAFLVAQDRPPQILQIYRDFVNAGQEAAFRSIEDDAARICAELHCPNAHLAIESLDRPIEVWWLTPYASEGDRDRVAHGYATNRRLTTALGDVSRRKLGVVGTPIDVTVRYNAALSRGVRWSIAGARFFVAEIAKGDPSGNASVFDAPDGSRVALQPARTRDEATSVAASWGSRAKVFAIRPYWGMPAPDWIAADLEFWKASPSSSTHR